MAALNVDHAHFKMKAHIGVDTEPGKAQRAMAHCGRPSDVAKPYLRQAELPLDHPERVLDLCPDAGLLLLLLARSGLGSALCILVHGTGEEHGACRHAVCVVDLWMAKKKLIAMLGQMRLQTA